MIGGTEEQRRGVIELVSGLGMFECERDLEITHFFIGTSKFT